MLKFLFLLGVALQPFLAMGQECVLCPVGFTNFMQQDKCYKAYSMKVNWDDAQTFCEKFGSHLVTVTTNDSLNLLREVVEPIKGIVVCEFHPSCTNSDVGGPAFWTAGRRKHSYGPFIWVLNRVIKMEMEYTNWLKGEPNNVGGNEECVHFLARDKNLLWNDTRCELVNCFVCEVDL